MEKSCCGGNASQPCAGGQGPGDPFAWFGRMIANCLEYAQAAKREGRPVVGILCEYTPRELILAAGGVPVILHERVCQGHKLAAHRRDAGATQGGQDAHPPRLGGRDARPPKLGGPDARAPVRVLMTGVPVVHGAERVVDIIESAGGAVVCMENCAGLKPILEDVDASAADPMRALAEKYYHLPCSVMTRNSRRMDMLRELVRDYRPECVVELVWQACLTYDVESYAVKRLVEGELGLPYLKIVTDYSPSDSARISMRVEALYETTRARRNGL